MKNLIIIMAFVFSATTYAESTCEKINTLSEDLADALAARDFAKDPYLRQALLRTSSRLAAQLSTLEHETKEEKLVL